MSVLTAPITPLVRSALGGAAMARDLRTLSDEDVLARVTRGDDGALAELYDRFGSLAFGLALRILHDRGLAEDAVQEAFIGVWRQGGRFERGRGSARSWILTLVHRRAVDLVRRQERQPDAVPDPQPATPEAGADEAAVTRDERARVQAALAQLPDDQRTAIELAYYGGLTQSELADRLNEPLGTIKSRMFNGLRRLHGILSTEEAR
jgi:RNA polymerase sigma-70 factor (ECF subfamily)